MKVITWLFFIFFAFCAFLFVDEVLWNLDSNKDILYTIEVTKTTGETKLINVKLPHDTHFQVNHHRSYGKYDFYKLEYVKDGFLGGHWNGILVDVTDFKIISKNKVK